MWEQYTRCHQFCTSSDGVTAITYFRDSRVLLVVVKENSSIRNGEVTLKTMPLGLGHGKMLVMDVIDKRAEVKRTRQGQLEFSEIDLAKGPRMYVLQKLPDGPSAIWHSPATWQSELVPSGDQQKLVMRGVPECKLECILWCGTDGPPTISQGGELTGYDQASGLVTVTGHADSNARAVISLSW